MYVSLSKDARGQTLESDSGKQEYAAVSYACGLFLDGSGICYTLVSAPASSCNLYTS